MSTFPDSCLLALCTSRTCAALAHSGRVCCREEGAQHLTLPFHPSVLKRTVEILYTTPAACGGVAEAPGQDFVPAEAPSGPPSIFFSSNSPGPGSSQAGRH